MHKKHEALDTHMLVLVSRNGFTKPVRVKAKFYNIEAITFDDAMTTDWDLVARMTESGFFEITSFHYDCKLVYELLDGSLGEIPVSPAAAFIAFEDNTPVTINQIVLHFLNEPRAKDVLLERIDTTDEREFHMVYELGADPWFVDLETGRAPVRKLVVDLKAERASTPIKFSIGWYRADEVAHGYSTDDQRYLLFMLLRKSDGSAQGFLCDESGLRTLHASGSLGHT